jgi:MFS family permease
MGLVNHLNLIGDEYSNASSAFYIAVLVFSFPNMWLLNRFPIAKCLVINLLGWGICSACHAALRNSAGLITLRVLSGAFESGISPALMLLTSQYFTYSEQATRFASWYTGMGNGQILGGLISYAFQWVPVSASLAGWRIVFLVLGLITMVVGLFVLTFVPDTPMDAGFLKKERRLR